MRRFPNSYAHISSKPKNCWKRDSPRFSSVFKLTVFLKKKIPPNLSCCRKAGPHLTSFLRFFYKEELGKRGCARIKGGVNKEVEKMKVNFIKVKNNAMTWRQVENREGKVFMRLKYRTRKIRKVPEGFFS